MKMQAIIIPMLIYSGFSYKTISQETKLISICMASFISFMAIFIFLEITFLLLAFWTLFTLIYTKVPFVRTPEKNLEIALAELNLKPGAKLYDLGCGDGRMLFLAEKAGLAATGYELSPYPFFKAYFNKIFSGKRAKIHWANFLQANLKPAEGVFLFLVPGVMARTEKKLKNDLKPGTPIVSYGIQFPGWTAKKILNTLPSKTYVYRT